MKRKKWEFENKQIFFSLRLKIEGELFLLKDFMNIMKHGLKKIFYLIEQESSRFMASRNSACLFI